MDLKLPRGHSDSFTINVESFRTFKGPLFFKQIKGRGPFINNVSKIVSGCRWVDAARCLQLLTCWVGWYGMVLAGYLFKNTIKTVAGKKNPAIQIFLFVFPLK